MSLNILHVISSTFYAGSVAYAVKIAEKQAEIGNRVIIVSDKTIISSKIQCIPLPVSNRSMLSRLKNIYKLKQIIKSNNINIVHGHSRAASWISYFAVKGTKIPLVSTIHGRQIRKNIFKKYDVYGEKVIVICPNLYSHLINEIKLSPDKLVLIPNGIDIEEINTVQRQRLSDSEKIISVIGRFNGPKGENFGKLFKHIFPNLLTKNSKLKIHLCGPEWESLSREGKDAYIELKIKYKDRIQNHGFKDRILEEMANSDIVIGAGRVALESTFLKIPVFAIGEAYTHGFLSPYNIKEAMDSNFGDILPVNKDYAFEPQKILEEFDLFLENKLPKADLSTYLSDYKLNDVVDKIMDVYRASVIKKVHPQFIPILMYHKIPENPIDSKHRIFVTSKNFEKHLKFFRFRKLTSITFSDYYAYSNGDLPISEFPRKPFMLTFDDGYADNYENALPLTQKYGFKGVLYLLGDFSATSNFWDKNEDEHSNRLMIIDQKKAFVDAGWEIGAHTLSHCNLTELSFEKALVEICRSKVAIEEILDTRVNSFAYPYGFYNNQIKALVEESDIKFGIATDSGGMTIEDDHYAVFRINMFPEENMFQLYKKTSKWYRKYYRKKRGK